MDIDKEIQKLVDQYNESIENKNKLHDFAQKCLGKIEVLQQIKEENAKNDKEDNRKDVKKS